MLQSYGIFCRLISPWKSHLRLSLVNRRFIKECPWVQCWGRGGKEAGVGREKSSWGAGSVTALVDPVGNSGSGMAFLSWDEMARLLYSCIHPSLEEIWPGVRYSLQLRQFQKGLTTGADSCSTPSSWGNMFFLEGGSGCVSESLPYYYHFIIEIYKSYIPWD